MAKSNRHDPDLDFRDPDAMDSDAAARQMRHLEQLIRRHDQRYYEKDRPIISDAEYDRLLARLKQLEQAFPDLAASDSPSQRVAGRAVDFLPSARHLGPMLSLDSVQQAEDVAAFVRRAHLAGAEAFWLEPKYDGLSMEVVYEDGRFVRAVTRGDGEVGEDVSHTFRHVHGVPRQLKDGHPERLAVRGEAYLPLQAFQAINRQRLEAGQEPFANPRNAAAGALRRHDPALASQLGLAFVAYEVLDGADDLASHGQVLDHFVKWGLPVGEHNRRTAGKPRIVEQSTRAYYDELLGGRDELPFEADGVVVAVDDHAARHDMGTRARNPRWAVAWKFPPRRQETILRDIAIQVGRTGRLTPVALLDPVDVGGVTVSRASLHNIEQIERLGVKVGDRVRVQRAGDVIPQVVERLDDGHGPTFAMPDRCPACSTASVADGPNRYCPAALACPAQLEARIVHYASRGGLDIEGLGPRTARALHDAGLIQSVADLYGLSQAQVAELEGYGEQAARNLIDAINASRSPSLDRFIAALGLPHVGARNARALAHSFETIHDLLGAEQESLASIQGLGAKTAAAIRSFLDQEENAHELRRLLDAGIKPEATKATPAARRPLEGQTFVITGSLETWTRSEARAAIEAQGGRVTGSVSNKTSYIVSGSQPGSKLDQAKHLGIPILNETDLHKLLQT